MWATKRKTRRLGGLATGAESPDVVAVAVAGRSPAEVLIPKLPFQVPKTFINNMPNQFANDIVLLATFRRFTAV